MRDKLISLRDTKNDRHAMLRSVSDRRLDVHQRLQNWEGRLRQLQADSRDHISEKHPAVIEVEAEIKNASAELARLTERNAELTTSWQAAARLLTSLEKYLIDVEDGGIRLHEGDASPLKAGETAIDALERAARRTRTLKADRQEVLASAFPVAVAKKLFREHLHERIEAARPDVSPLIDRLEPIEFPQKRVGVSAHGGSASAVYMIDPVGLLGWLFPKEFTAAIDRELAAAGDDEHALTVEQRIAKLAEVDADTLASERDEASYSELAGLLPRADLDPRAALSLHADMPAPKRD
ncbi:hypothetical protein [Bradyrhizobium huanghuaihaiense]|uniref:hypothetical protein n=1 Tax=Bradyrhizobium huanghuaihaiense TaxID=990078 RepID=UPI0011A8B6FE|nr:hypothetical protein [Bradyrhizobium huanghuaihaiense]